MSGGNSGQLGRMEQVDLREIWTNEAQGFTPWLAKPENLAILGETINLELECESQEQDVGAFRADILCRDTINNHYVLIENQLEKTDHTHLGQIMTYAAGLDAVTIIWLSRRFTDEHRAALDWLNRVTDDNISFFGVEIELWRIAGSPIAPKFNLVCKPNDWTKTVRTVTEDGQLTPTQAIQLEYWRQFRQLMQESASPVRCPAPYPGNWNVFAIGRSCFRLIGKMNTQKKYIAAYLCMDGPERMAHYHLLHDRHREEIEKKIPQKLEWRELPDRKESQVITYLNDADPTDKNDWPRQHNWLKETLELFNKVFRPIVKELDASEYAPADDDQGA